MKSACRCTTFHSPSSGRKIIVARRAPVQGPKPSPGLPHSLCLAHSTSRNTRILRYALPSPDRRHLVTIAVEKGEERAVSDVCPEKMVRQVLRLGLLVTLLALALVACEAEEWQLESKPPPLPRDPTLLYPGEYRSERFEPSLSFTVGENWSNVPLEMSDSLQIARGERERLAFTNVQEVFKPGTLEVVEGPKYMVGWFQNHPYLQASKPEPVMVGGVEGKQFDVVAKNVPQEYYGLCSQVSGPGHCVDLIRTSSWLPENLIAVYEEEKARVIVLEDVEGETVTIYYSSSATKFNEFALEAQRVLDSVQWSSS
jgi:hypothetical protein